MFNSYKYSKNAETIEPDSVFMTLSPINTVHIGKLNIFGVVILQSDQPTCFRFSVYGLASLHCVISLRYTFGDASLTQNILERRVNKAIYKKVATRVDNDQKLIDGDSYLDPEFCSIITSFFSNLYEPSQAKKLVYVQNNSNCMTKNKYYDNEKQNKRLFNITRPATHL